MRILSSGLFVIFMIFHSGITAGNYTLTLATKSISGKDIGLNPGDTIFIEAGLRTSLRISDLSGDSTNYITIINKDGLVEISNDYTYGLSVHNSKYFRITGSGVSSLTYGIKISGTKTGSSGLGLSNFSTDYEVDHLEICHTGFAGIFAFTQPTCDLSANRGNFLQKNCSIHHNYIHHTAGEGMYIGHSFYTGFTKTCDGSDVVLFPHEIHGMKIYDNIIDSCGMDGIQVGCVSQDCEIHHNLITNYGTSKIEVQHAGIQIAAGTTGLCYNNLIMNGSGSGIMIFGTGNNTIFNNIIINSGYNYFSEDPDKRIYGIFCDDRATIPNAPFNFINNTIINPKTDGIRFFSQLSANNKIYNNAIVNPGAYGKYSNPDQSFVYFSNKDVKLDIRNNYYQKNIPEGLIFETIADVYNYTSSLSLTGNGLNVSNLGINQDFAGNDRPATKRISVGAFEFMDLPDYDIFPQDTFLIQKSAKLNAGSQINISNNFHDSDLQLYPNPCSGIFVVQAFGDSKLRQVTVRAINGRVVAQDQPRFNKYINQGNDKLLNPGIYLVDIELSDRKTTQKLVVR